MKTNPAFGAERMGVAKLAKMAFAGWDMRPVWQELLAKVSDDPADAGIAMDLAVVAQLLGEQETGLAVQKKALEIQRLFRSPCGARAPGLRVLALAADMDMGGNTPIEFLLEDTDVELTTLYVVPGLPLPNPLPEHDLAIVIAPDDDKTQGVLDEIERLAPTWPRKILNSPERIRVLDRDRLYQLLNTVPGLEIPMTARLSREDLAALDGTTLSRWLEDGSFPLIVRPTGSHAGRGLAKLDTEEEIADYLVERPEPEFFISRYVDYASADGQYRKYRLVCIDGVAYACHMAIADEWKVWYLNANMICDGSKRAEEAHFMANFEREFAVRHAGALGEAMNRIGLDYFQIDCAETKDGKLLVFEADNTAIVHNMDPPGVFPYKPAQMHKVFDAFTAMLYDRAAKSRARAA